IPHPPPSPPPTPPPAPAAPARSAGSPSAPQSPPVRDRRHLPDRAQLINHLRDPQPPPELCHHRQRTQSLLQHPGYRDLRPRPAPSPASPRHPAHTGTSTTSPGDVFHTTPDPAKLSQSQRPPRRSQPHDP